MTQPPVSEPQPTATEQSAPAQPAPAQPAAEQRPMRSVRRGRSLLAASAMILLALPVGWSLRHWRIERILQQARSWQQAGDLVAAEREYRRYLDYRTDAGDVMMELASQLEPTQPDAALALYRSVPVRSPEFIHAARQVARLCLEQGRDSDAEGALLYLSEKLPTEAGPELALAQLSARRKDYDRQREHAVRCRQRDPERTEAYLLEAEALDDLSRPGEMIEPLEAVLRIDPELPPAHLNLAYALQLLGRNEEALPHVNWFLERHPNSAAGLRILALVERGLGHSEQALHAVRRSLEQNPRSLDAALLEGELLLFLRRPQEAFDRLAPWNEQLPGERRLLNLLIQIAVRLKRPELVEQYRQQVQQLPVTQ